MIKKKYDWKTAIMTHMFGLGWFTFGYTFFKMSGGFPIIITPTSAALLSVAVFCFWNITQLKEWFPITRYCEAKYEGGTILEYKNKEVKKYIKVQKIDENRYDDARYYYNKESYEEEYLIPVPEEDIGKAEKELLIDAL